MDGHGLLDANGAAACMAKNYSGEIFFGQYDSEFKMRNAVSQIAARIYASGTTPDGTIQVFTIIRNPNEDAILEPLTQFEFTIQKAPRFGS